MDATNTMAIVSLVLTVLLTLVGALAGLWVKSLQDSLKQLREDVNALEEDQQALKDKIAETYLRRDDCHRASDEYGTRLQTIERKIDRLIERLGGLANG